MKGPMAQKGCTRRSRMSQLPGTTRTMGWRQVVGTRQQNQRQNTSGVQRGLQERWSQRGEEGWHRRFINGLWMERWRYQKALSSAAGSGQRAAGSGLRAAGCGLRAAGSEGRGAWRERAWREELTDATNGARTRSQLVVEWSTHPLCQPGASAVGRRLSGVISVIIRVKAQNGSSMGRSEMARGK